MVLAAGGSVFGQSASPSAPGAASGGGAVTLTIDQAINRAMSNQPLIQQAQAAVEAARARVGEAESTYFPGVSASGSYNLIEPDQSFTFPMLGTFSLLPTNNWDFHLGLNQVIYQFGRRGAQVSLARSGVSAALVGVDQIRMSLAYQTAVGFFTVLFMERQLAALDEQAQNLQEHLRATQVKADTGAATRYDELATEVRVSALRSQRIEADSQYDRQVLGLKQILGLKDSDTLVLSGDLRPPAGPSEDEDALVALALSRRPDVRQAVQAESAAELSARLAYLTAFPTISAHASAGYKNGLLPDINAMTFNWVAGVQVNVPIFQGLLAVRTNDENQKKILAARENTLSVRRTATTQVIQALHDLQASRRQVETAKAQEDQARQMLEVVKLQYDLGMLTNLEYLDAQAAMERAQVGSLQAGYREVVGEYALLQAAGASIWKGD